MTTALDHIAALRAELDLLESVLAPAVTVPPTGDVPDWLARARTFIGTREIPGDDHNPLILEWLGTTSLGRWGASRDETAWCSAFVNAMMLAEGIEGSGSAMARSWLGWGVELEDPRPGCVVVLRRGAPPAGHVGILERADGESVHLLGGNQGNEVSVRAYPRSRVIGYRWPDPGQLV